MFVCPGVDVFMEDSSTLLTRDCIHIQGFIAQSFMCPETCRCSHKVDVTCLIYSKLECVDKF